MNQPFEIWEINNYNKRSNNCNKRKRMKSPLNSPPTTTSSSTSWWELITKTKHTHSSFHLNCLFIKNLVKTWALTIVTKGRRWGKTHNLFIWFKTFHKQVNKGMLLKQYAKTWMVFITKRPHCTLNVLLKINVVFFPWKCNVRFYFFHSNRVFFPSMTFKFISQKANW